MIDYDHQSVFAVFRSTPPREGRPPRSRPRSPASSFDPRPRGRRSRQQSCCPRRRVGRRWRHRRSSGQRCCHGPRYSPEMPGCTCPDRAAGPRAARPRQYQDDDRTIPQASPPLADARQALASPACQRALSNERSRFPSLPSRSSILTRTSLLIALIVPSRDCVDDNPFWAVPVTPPSQAQT